MRKWKTIETRTHNRLSILKGQTILIHAGLGVDTSPYTLENPYLTREQIAQNPDEVVSGYILGTAFVEDFMILDSFDSEYALIDCGSTVRYGLYLNEINKFENPIPAKGSQGIWYFDLSTNQKVKKS